MLFVIFFLLELFFLFFLSQFLTRSLSRLLMKITKNQSLTVNLLSFLFLPGIVIHELSHLLSASLLLVPVGEIEFVPKIKEGGGVKMGSVGIGKTDIFRRMLIGTSPFFIGVVIITSSLFYFSEHFFFSPFLTKVFLFYLLFEVGNTMFSSRKDLEGALEFILAFILIGALLYFAGLRPDIVVVQNLFLNLPIDFFQKVDQLLLIPLGIDAAIIGITKLVAKL